MSTNLIICPDCGGVIGGTGDSDHGRPCTCFANPKRGDTSMFGNAAPKVKVCCKCGKDVTGRKRLRDSLGYWCYDCHKADQDEKRPEGVKCPQCGRRVASSALIDFDGVLICSKCHKDHLEFTKQKQKYRPGVSNDSFQAHDRKRLYVLLGIFTLLLLIIILSRLHILPRLF